MDADQKCSVQILKNIKDILAVHRERILSAEIAMVSVLHESMSQTKCHILKHISKPNIYFIEHFTCKLIRRALVHESTCPQCISGSCIILGS